MNVLEFAEKKGWYKNWLLVGDKSLKEIERAFKENEKNKKKYFVVKKKKDKWQTLLPSDAMFLALTKDDIIW